MAEPGPGAGPGGGPGGPPWGARGPRAGLTGRVRLLWRVLMAAWASAWVWNFTKAQPRTFRREQERVSAPPGPPSPRCPKNQMGGYLCWCRPAPAAQCTRLWSRTARTSSGRPHLSAASLASPQRASGLLGSRAQDGGHTQGLLAAFQSAPAWDRQEPHPLPSALPRSSRQSPDPGDHRLSGVEGAMARDGRSYTETLSQF